MRFGDANGAAGDSEGCAAVWFTDAAGIWELLHTAEAFCKNPKMLHTEKSGL